MPLNLVRIDDRLLHGQVTHGWGPVLRPELVVVADDRAAAHSWERETYEASGPETAEVRVLTLGQCVEAAAHGDFDRPRTLILVRGPRELAALINLGFAVTSVNVGGLHEGPYRVPYRSDLQISPAEAAVFARLAAAGVSCYYQPLPHDPKRDLPDPGSAPQAFDEPRDATT